MIRKLVAVASLAVVSLLAVPGVAQAYTAPDEPTLVLQIDPDDIVLGETPVPFESRDFFPGSDARFSVSAPGVSSSEIALTVTASGAGAGETSAGSVETVVAGDGTFTVDAVFPEAASYIVFTEGLDKDGNPTTVSLTVNLATIGAGGGGGSGGGGGGGGGLAGTGFTGSSALLAGGALAALGTGVMMLSRRRTSPVREDIDA